MEISAPDRRRLGLSYKIIWQGPGGKSEWAPKGDGLVGALCYALAPPSRISINIDYFIGGPGGDWTLPLSLRHVQLRTLWKKMHLNDVLIMTHSTVFIWRNISQKNCSISCSYFYIVCFFNQGGRIIREYPQICRALTITYYDLIKKFYYFE